MTDCVTPLILTWNEAPNITRCLDKLRWAKRVVVIDSGSTDNTEQLARAFSNVEFIVRSFDNHTAQWNFGLAQIASPWVLSMDADYILDSDFEQELATRTVELTISAWMARFHYVISGLRLRGSLYPPRAVLFQKAKCRYVPDGHTQRLEIEGPSSFLNAVIDHDDRKPLSRWILSQDAYAKLEAVKLMEADLGAPKITGPP
ncbi:MAG: glycosyltransferase family 2 protein [Nitrospira sp.]